MSFAFTPEEQTRVTLAQLGGIKLDPIGYADLSVIVVLSCLYFFNFVALGFLIWNRNYPPLKSKYPFLMATIMVAMFIYFLGDIVLKSHVHVRGILSNCMAFCVWMRIVFGAYTVSALTTIRSYALFCIFLCNRAYRGKFVYYSWCIAVILAVVFIIVAYTMPGSEPPVHYVSLIEMCSMSYPFRAVVQGLLWLVWIINAVINFKLRHINSSFNESLEMLVACICVFTLLAFNTIILYVFPLYPTRTSLRVTETLCSHLIANFLWWFIMFKSMYNCAFRRQKYLGEWKDKLFKDGLQKQYQISRTNPFSVTMMSVDSQSNEKHNQLVMLPRGMVTDHDIFDARTSYSNHRSSQDLPNPHEFSPQEPSNLWRPDIKRTLNPECQQTTNGSSSSTINDSSAMPQLAQYNFPLPPKST